MVRDAAIYYPKKDSNNICLMQMTDTHLFADPDGQLLGVNTANSMQAVVDLMSLKKHEADVLLATGDISQDYTSESYQRFNKCSEALALPCHYLPGNHDEWQLMQQHMIAKHIKPQRQIVFDEWQVLLLNSTIAKKPAGFLPELEFQFIQKAIEQYPEKHVLICLHHHPLKINCDWLDRHWLTNGDEFLQRIGRYAQVRGVLWGHIHQEFDDTHRGEHHDISLMATPSTCIQFTPQSDHFAVDGLQPGYRLLHLHANGSIVTQVHRVVGDRFTPENEVSGY
ncbi:3',5'-cyclic-AMP phosphodiesterase [Parashewanella spongiae]|uniref:3',5'-cyclic-AMP phosphodiesterase n=1 Tax=Parashewanella spongiae TaxID=342950 RepID=A0A3A6UF93_9GAMM|nr:3',5'-cyclic-AMP phosphodiesterase [Parashewanella spongiae]MCL1078325.1 3',5'-cyclic-AMP phosphodiesterase [Parashewanella spongiae]RJY17476.1 3',5'-cyclic-AMP phosphodiesterase [Parashewanella spongiae]